MRLQVLPCEQNGVNIRYVVHSTHAITQERHKQVDPPSTTPSHTDSSIPVLHSNGVGGPPLQKRLDARTATRRHHLEAVFPSRRVHPSTLRLRCIKLRRSAIVRRRKGDPDPDPDPGHNGASLSLNLSHYPSTPGLAEPELTRWK